jgi:hypothetical protein
MKNLIVKYSILFSIIAQLSGCGGLAVERSLNTKSWGYKKVLSPEPVRAGEKAQRFEVRKGDCSDDPGWSDCDNDRERSEIKVLNNFYPESDIWFSWSFYIPEDYKSAERVTTTIGQIHQRSSVRARDIGGTITAPPLLQIRTIGNSFGTTYHRFSGNLPTLVTKGEFEEITTVDALRGKWTDVVVHFRPTKENGILEIYINGKLERTIDNPMIIRPDNFYLKYGIYRSFVTREHPNVMPTQIVYFDEVRMGKTRMEVDAQLNPELKPVD